MKKQKLEIGIFIDGNIIKWYISYVLAHYVRRDLEYVPGISAETRSSKLRHRPFKNSLKYVYSIYTCGLWK